MICNLTEKVALVTGAANGIGAACVDALVAAGATVMATDMDGNACARRFANQPQVLTLEQNVVDEGRWSDVVEATVKGLGGLDILVNNAGIYVGGLLENNSLEEFSRVQRVNVDSIFMGCRAAVLAMKPGGAAGRGGSIVNLSSVAGLVGVAGHSAYGATKGAVRLYTKHAAAEFGALGYGIRVNSVHPGVIETDMGDQVFQDFVDIGLMPDVETARQFVLGKTALGRLGTAEDIANMVLFLASDAASYVTGAEFVVDGGISAQ